MMARTLYLAHGVVKRFFLAAVASRLCDSVVSPQIFFHISDIGAQELLGTMFSVEPELGPTLRKVRLDRKWTQVALAFRLRISLEYLQRIELGRDTPDCELTKKIKAWLADPNARLD